MLTYPPLGGRLVEGWVMDERVGCEGGWVEEGNMMGWVENVG